jgi:hypothetical protein
MTSTTNVRISAVLSVIVVPLLVYLLTTGHRPWLYALALVAVIVMWIRYFLRP